LPVETPSLFAQAIQEHLELKQRNSQLRDLPLENYKSDDPFENHPLFKTEEQARIEETLDGTEPAVVADVPAEPERASDDASLEDSLWGQTTREFDWGD
jgi:hypothetical protein